MGTPNSRSVGRLAAEAADTTGAGAVWSGTLAGVVAGGVVVDGGVDGVVAGGGDDEG